MDSLDAQCLLMQLTDGEVRPPDVWRHDHSGALSCAYETGERTFTWPAEDVTAMARKWRESHQSRAPERARLFRTAHERLQTLACEAGLRAADVVVHDLGRSELRGFWEKEEVVVVIEEIGAQ